MRYLLDTNIIIYFLKNGNENIAKKLSETNEFSIVIPSVVKAEIEYRASKAQDYQKTISVYNEFINNFSILPFDDKAAVKYGQIRSNLEKKGQIIGGNDMLIAAIAMSNNCVLVTHNVAEFSRVEWLFLEDWSIA